MNTRNYIILGITIAIMGVGSLYAKYIFIKSKNHFDGIITKSMAGKSKECGRRMYNIAVACFYALETKEQLKRRKREMDLEAYKEVKRVYKKHKEKIERLCKELKKLSKNPKYRKAWCHFMAINVLDRDNADLAKDYKITSEPTIMLFQDGRPFRDNKGKIVKLYGYVNTDAIDGFVSRYFSKFLRANRNCLAIIDQIRSTYYGWYPGFGFGIGIGYPGWGWGYGGWGYGGCGYGCCW